MNVLFFHSIYSYLLQRCLVYWYRYINFSYCILLSACQNCVFGLQESCKHNIHAVVCFVCKHLHFIQLIDIQIKITHANVFFKKHNNNYCEMGSYYTGTPLKRTLLGPLSVSFTGGVPYLRVNYKPCPFLMQSVQDSLLMAITDSRSEIYCLYSS